MSEVKHVVFDLDGTLVDSAAGILKSIGDALSHRGMAPKVALTSDIIGPPLMKTLALVSGADDPQLLAELAADFKRQYDSTGYQSSLPYPGISDALKELFGQGVKLHIATNKRGTPTRLLLDYLNWANLFGSVYCLDELEQCADKGQMLELLLSEQNIPALTTLYVGDTEGDAIAAKSNQIPFIHAAWGYGNGALATAAKYSCNDARRLVPLIHEHQA